jgi:hypothetical protein
MNEDGHRQAVEELRASRARLDPEQDIRAYVELSFGMAFHLVCVGAQRRHNAHRENHEGLARWLRGRGHLEQADWWDEVEGIRIGRWYGRRGNGNAAHAIDRLVERFEGWALAESGQ